MNLAALRTAVRNFYRSQSTDAGTLFPADNVTLDFFINSATELVVLDLVEFMPDVFLISENISLDTTKTEYTLTAEYLQIKAIKRNVTSKYPEIITYVDYNEELLVQYVGQTKDEPEAWTLRGNAIIFLPKAAKNTTNYAKAYLIVPEAATIGTDGPTYIPRLAHRLIPFMACILISAMFDEGGEAKWEKIYQYWLKKVRDVSGSRVQQQPQFLRGSIMDKTGYDPRDPAFYDESGFFD